MHAAVERYRAVGIVEGVTRVEHITRFNIAPDRVLALAVLGQQPHPRFVLWIPLIGKAFPAYVLLE